MHTEQLLTTRAAAVALGIPERTLRARAARARQRADYTAQEIGRAWVAPLSWWRAIAEASAPVGRPRLSKRVDESP